MRLSSHLASHLAGTALIGALALAAPSWSAAMPVDVSFTSTGSAGDWTLDFSVTNNIPGPFADMTVFFFGVQLPGADAADAFNTFTPLLGPFSVTPPGGGADVDVDAGWLDLDFADGHGHLSPPFTLDGFILHTSGDALPSSIPWVVFAAPGSDDDIGDDDVSGHLVTYSGVIGGVPAIPEPSTYLLMALGLAALWGFRFREQTTRHPQ